MKNYFQLHNQAIEQMEALNNTTLRRVETFQGDLRPREEKFEDFLHLKHKFPYIGFVHCSAGKTDFTLFHANDDIVAWEYFWFGKDSYETEIINTWLDWCQGPSVVLDIGAYTGLMSILAGLLHPETKVELFEPMDRTIERAKINLKANQIDKQVTLHNKAASNRCGPSLISMPRNENFLGTGNSIDDKGGKVIDVKQIQCVKVDDVLPDIMPTVIKIDVEGHELACLEGMEKILSRSRPKMIVEVWERTRTDVLKMLEAMNYVCTPFEDHERRVMNFRCEPK